MSDASVAPRIETAGLCARWMRALASAGLATRSALAALTVVVLLALPAPARGQGVEVLTLAAARGEDAVELDYALRFALPPPVEDALRRGVPLHFVAQATVRRPRWYWRDERVARAQRSWRLSYQPLTSQWRISQGGLNQNYETLSEALLTISRVSRWRIAPSGAVEPNGDHYVQFSWRLDTEQLPRPMQIGIGGQPDWALGVERTLPLR